MKKLMFGFMVLAYLAAGLVTVCGALFLEAMAQSDAPQLAIAATLWCTIAGAAIVFCILMAVGAREIYLMPIRRLRALTDGDLSFKLFLEQKLERAAEEFHLNCEWEIRARRNLLNTKNTQNKRDVEQAEAEVARTKKRFWELHALMKSFNYEVRERYTDYLK